MNTPEPVKVISLKDIEEISEANPLHDQYGRFARSDGKATAGKHITGWGPTKRNPKGKRKVKSVSGGVAKSASFQLTKDKKLKKVAGTPKKVGKGGRKGKASKKPCGRKARSGKYPPKAKHRNSGIGGGRGQGGLDCTKQKTKAAKKKCRDKMGNRCLESLWRFLDGAPADEIVREMVEQSQYVPASLIKDEHDNWHVAYDNGTKVESFEDNEQAAREFHAAKLSDIAESVETVVEEMSLLRLKARADILLSKNRSRKVNTLKDLIPEILDLKHFLEVSSKFASRLSGDRGGNYLSAAGTHHKAGNLSVSEFQKKFRSYSNLIRIDGDKIYVSDDSDADGRTLTQFREMVLQEMYGKRSPRKSFYFDQYFLKYPKAKPEVGELIWITGRGGNEAIGKVVRLFKNAVELDTDDTPLTSSLLGMTEDGTQRISSPATWTTADRMEEMKTLSEAAVKGFRVESHLGELLASESREELRSAVEAMRAGEARIRYPKTAEEGEDEERELELFVANTC